MSFELTVAVLKAIRGFCYFVIMLPIILTWFAIVYVCWKLLVWFCEHKQKYHYDIDSTAD